MCTENNLDDSTSCNINRVRQLFLKHGNFLHVIIRLHINNQDDADEFFQELFLFLIIKPLPANVKNLKGLLSKIVADRAKDFYRKKASNIRNLGKYSEIIKKKATPDAPEIDIIDKEEADRFYGIIKKNLSPHEAEALILKYRHDYANKEISKKMKINSRSVSRYVSVGIKKLKKILG